MASPVGYKYLNTLAELEQNAIACLGTMDQGSYNYFAAKMLGVAIKAGIVRPVMAVGLKFKEAANTLVTEQSYPILEREWEVFKSDAREMCEYMPKVFVVDGSKFELRI